MITTMELTLHGVLTAAANGQMQSASSSSSGADRQKIINLLRQFTRRTYLTCSDEELIGKAAIITFLRAAGIRTEAELKDMTDEEQRNTLITENQGHTRIPLAELQKMNNLALVDVGLGWKPMPPLFSFGALLVNWYPDQASRYGDRYYCREATISILNNFTADDLTKRNDDYQTCDDSALIGKAAVLVFLRETGLCDDARLKTMSDEEQRGMLVAENHFRTGIANPHLQAMTNQRLVELALEWGLTAGSSSYSGDGSVEKPLLFDAPRTILEPDNSYYVHTSVHLNATREAQFNALKNRRTKNVTVSGVKVVFGPGNAYKKQMAFEGNEVLDLKNLEIHADQVIVRSPLRFPGTNVTIYARELIFEDNGSIDTSPAGFLAPAVSRFRGEYGPLDKEGGSPTYVAADGAHGEKAGDFHLYVRRILEKSNGQTRLIAKGSKGQTAEDGGKKQYQPRMGDQPAAEKGKNLMPVSCKDFRDYVQDVTDNHSVGFWRWPGEVSSPEEVRQGDFALKNNQVTYCRLILFDDNIATGQTRRTFLPNKSTRVNSEVHIAPLGVKTVANRDSLRLYEQDAAEGRQRPGDGEDAYASGRPGNGGAGGRVAAWVPSNLEFEHLCAVDGGAAGDRSNDVEGGAPGTPFPAYWTNMRLVRREEISWAQSSYSPNLSVEDCSARPGRAAAGRTASPGARGAIERKDATLRSWVSPLALGAVVDYARDAFRNGHRDVARNLLDPYYYVLFCEKRELPAPLLAQLTQVGSLRTNILSNLDYYGNPPGWLPRLDVATNYQIWNLFSKRSSATLYFASKIESDWDKINDEQKALDEVSKAVKEEGDTAVELLQTAFQKLDIARKSLDKVKEQFQTKQAEVDRLRLQAGSDAKTKLVEQQVFKGVMNIVGGLAQSIPVGQPFLGMAGKTITLAGDIDWNDPDASKQIGSFFGGLGKETSAFLKENEDLFIERSGSGIPKPAGAKERLSLKNQLAAANGAVESLDGKVKKRKKSIDDAVTDEWAQTLAMTSARVQGEVRQLSQSIEGLQASVAALPDNSPSKSQLKQQLEAKKADLAELDSFHKELETTASLKYVDGKAKFYEELSYLEKGVKAKATEAVAIKEELLTKADALEQKNAELDKLDDEYAIDKEAAETKTKDLLTNLSGLGDGISKIGRGIAALARPCDEKEVDRLTEQLLQGSKYGEEYRKLLAEVKEINKQKAQAVAEFSKQQQLISTHTDRITSAMAELDAISNQRQIAQGVLDPDMKQHLRGMVNRAKESLLWAQYHFVKAWQYEDLTDVPDDFHNLGMWVDRFREFERVKAGLPKDLTKLTLDDHKTLANSFLDEKDFAAIRNQIRDACVTDLIQPILEDRQHQPLRTVNTHHFVLTEEQVKRLCEQGNLTFCLMSPDDFTSPVGGPYDMKAKIEDVNLERFKVETDDSNLSTHVEFVHSGISVLYGTDEKYYKFQKGPDDSAISWGFKYSQKVYTRLMADGASEDEVWSFVGEKPISKDELDEKENAVINEELGKKLKYSEYRPALSSEITMWLDRGRSRDTKYQEFLAKFKKVEVEFAVKYSNAGTRVPAESGRAARA